MQQTPEEQQAEALARGYAMAAHLAEEIEAERKDTGKTNAVKVKHYTGAVRLLALSTPKPKAEPEEEPEDEDAPEQDNPPSLLTTLAKGRARGLADYDTQAAEDADTAAEGEAA